MSIIFEAEATLANLGKHSDKVKAEVKTTVTRMTLKLLRKVKQDKLSGQVLHVQTGRLRRSINQKVIETDSKIEGLVGTNVEYARPHEMGFTDDVTVKEHLRTIKKAWGKDIEPKQIQISSHTRKVVFPEKSFLRSALRDMQPDIIKELGKAVGRGIA